jgi:hypothetical protein
MTDPALISKYFCRCRICPFDALSLAQGRAIRRAVACSGAGHSTRCRLLRGWPFDALSLAQWQAIRRAVACSGQAIRRAVACSGAGHSTRCRLLGAGHSTRCRLLRGGPFDALSLAQGQAIRKKGRLRIRFNLRASEYIPDCVWLIPWAYPCLEGHLVPPRPSRRSPGF